MRIFKVTEWIKCSDQMPSKDEKILEVYISEKNVMYNMRHDGWFRDTIYACRYQYESFIIESHGTIFHPTHWMKSPELPDQ
jgi:hypothetical protein